MREREPRVHRDAHRPRLEEPDAPEWRRKPVSSSSTYLARAPAHPRLPTAGSSDERRLRRNGLNPVEQRLGPERRHLEEHVDGPALLWEDEDDRDRAWVARVGRPQRVPPEGS